MRKGGVALRCAGKEGKGGVAMCVRLVQLTIFVYFTRERGKEGEGGRIGSCVC
jgi:hypothetical protein